MLTSRIRDIELSSSRVIAAFSNSLQTPDYISVQIQLFHTVTNKTHRSIDLWFCQRSVPLAHCTPKLRGPICLAAQPTNQQPACIHSRPAPCCQQKTGPFVLCPSQSQCIDSKLAISALKCPRSEGLYLYHFYSIHCKPDIWSLVSLL